MTITQSTDLSDVPTMFDGTYTHVDGRCPEMWATLSAAGLEEPTPTEGFGIGFPCSCADDLLTSAYGRGTGVAARLAGNVPGSTYSLPSGDGTGSAPARRGPSERQEAFLVTLVDRKIKPSMKDEYLTALRSSAKWTSRGVSAVIDTLLAAPDFRDETTPAPTRTNRYAAACRKCGGTVPAETGSLLKVGSSWVVEHIGSCPERKPVSVETGIPGEDGTPPLAAPLPDVPEGHYAYPSSGSNDLSFVRVDRPTEGRWAGRTFVKQVIGGHPDAPVARANVASVLASIVEFGVDLAAQTYGQEIGRCYRCNRHLTDETSRQLGIGPDCRSRS